MKKFLLIASFVAYSICNFAQSSCVINIAEKGAEAAMLSVAFSESHTFKFANAEEETYMIAMADNQEVAAMVLNKQYVITYTEQDVPTTVKEMIAESKLNLKGGVAFVSNLKANEVVNVYTADGAQVATTVANANGVAQINLSAMPKGIVVIKAGNSSFKLKK